MSTEAKRTPAKRLPSPFVAMLGYSIQQVVSGRRWMLLLSLVVFAAVGSGLLALQINEPGDEAFSFVVSAALFGLVIPLACLVVGDAVLGGEIRSGTFQLTWLSPVSVVSIVLARWLAGVVLAGSLLAATCALSAVVAGAPENAGAVALAALVTTCAYIAIFVFFGAVTRRATIWGLVFIYLVEQLLGRVLSGIAQQSPQWLGRGVYAGYASGADDLIRKGVPDGFEAIIRLAVISVIVLVIAIWRLRNLRLTGGHD